MENKKEKYELLCKQVEQLIAGETDEMAVFSNVAAVLKEVFPQEFFWVGFYRVVDNELLLGPFQGSVTYPEFAKGSYIKPIEGRALSLSKAAP